MRAVRFILAVFAVFFFVVSCGNAEQGFNVEKKYYLKDCIVKINFIWDESIEYPERFTVTREIAEQIKLAIVAKDAPYFGGGTTRELQHYVLYYADKCEDRRALTEKLIRKYFRANIENFPSYTIEDTGVEPEFDGAIPSGLWLDDKSNK